MALDTLEIFGKEYTNVAGFKATDDNDQIKTYIRPQGTLSITENGDGIDVTSYASVDVDVSGSTTAVIRDTTDAHGGTIREITTDEEIYIEPLSITSNGTYTASSGHAYDEVTVNVSGGGGIDLFDPTTPSGAVTSSFSGTTKSYACTERSGVTSIHLVNAISIGSYSIYNNSDLATVVGEKTAGIGNYGLARNANLTTVDILARNSSSMATIGNNAFNNDEKLNTIILRGVYEITLGGTGAFTGTPFDSGGTGGTLYVPQALISDYQSATNWSTILGYTNNQIKSIESTHTDLTAPIDLTLYYADGTPISS